MSNKNTEFDPNPNYLTIVALEDGLTVVLNYTSNISNCQYSIDSGEWIALSSGETTPAINKNSYVSIKATFSLKSSTTGSGTFTLSKKCNLTGNCTSLVYLDSAQTKSQQYSLFGFAFADLFYNCSTIIEVSSNFLPSKFLGEHSYTNMFENCKSLITPPKLPVEKMRNYGSYYGMFKGCTSLKTAPELPATTLLHDCYYSMFENCTSLVNAPELPATTLAPGCYSDMFNGCTSLVNAPELPATTLVGNCYARMFMRCSKLKYIKMMSIDAPNSSYTLGWTYGVSSTGTFVKNSNANWDVVGMDGVPSGWTIEFA